jgi:hypothetical protein
MATSRLLSASLLLIPLLPLALLGGCSSSKASPVGSATGGASGGGNADGGGGKGGATGAPVADVPGKLATAVCAVTKQCLGPADLSGSACVAQTVQKIEEGEFSRYQAAIDKKKVAYDSTKLAACIDAIGKAGCDIGTKRISTLCAGVFTGSVAAGASCTMSAECKDGLFCQISAPDGGAKPSCPGKCTALLAAGDACAINDHCKDGLLCSAGKCAAPVADGAACGGKTGEECKPGLLCIGAACKKISAVFTAAEGETCDLETVLCKEGFRCAVVSLDSAGKPVAKCEKPVTGPDGVPAACHLAFPEECPIGQFCELPQGAISGLCKILPGNGTLCVAQVPSDPNSPASLCREGTLCDPSDGTCKALQKAAGKCAAGAWCYSGICSDGTCVASLCQ